MPVPPDNNPDKDQSGPSPWRAKPGTAHHILPTSTSMIGVSITLVGLVKIAEGRDGPGHVDEYSGLAATLFLISALCSYVSLRTENRPFLSHLTEQVADACFLVGLVGITMIALFFAYEMI